MTSARMSALPPGKWNPAASTRSVGGMNACANRHRRAALVARSRAPRAHDAVVVDADGDRLRVAEAVRRRVTAAAGVVVVEPLDGIEPQQPSELREPPVDGAAEPRLERLRDAAGEALRREVAAQHGVEVLGPRGAIGARARGWDDDALGSHIRASA